MHQAPSSVDSLVPFHCALSLNHLMLENGTQLLSSPRHIKALGGDRTNMVWHERGYIMVSLVVTHWPHGIKLPSLA
ncbi:hypothetical protein GmHk_13G036924 [Glycine max]|nr:hypothetical protein GmHk_13G036924 [Glycine max]